jgi:hypothetical protein
MSYYDVEMVDSELKCSLCNEMLDDSRLLPCGDICCLKCIISQFNKNDYYECKCCENIHEKKDANKHPIPKLVSNLLEKTKNKISPNFIQLNFKQVLDEFEATLNRFDDKQKNYKTNLSDYCQLVRSQIIAKTQCIINDLKKNCNEMCKTVDHYENETKKEWDEENEVYQSSLATIINENRQIQHNMIQMYKNKTVDKSKIEEAIEIMKYNSIEIEKKCKLISNKIFNLKYLQNDENIGELLKVEKFEKLKLNQEDEPSSSIFAASFTVDGKSLLIFSDFDDHYNIHSSTCDLYHEYPAIKYKNGFNTFKKMDCYYLFNNKIIFVTSNTIYIEKYHSDPNGTDKSFANDLKYITICADNDIIFIMTEDYMVKCLNWRLNEIKTIGQNKDGFHFKGVQQMDIRDEQFYLRNSKKIEIVDVEDGTLIKTIKIKSYKFIIDDKKGHLIAFCYDSIQIFHLGSGDFISKIDLKDSIPKGYTFQDYKNQTCLLLSKNKTDLYSIKF